MTCGQTRKGTIIRGSPVSIESKRETHLSSVTSPVVLLAWVTLEIDCLQLCLLLKVDQRTQIGDEVVARLRRERIERPRSQKDTWGVSRRQSSTHPELFKLIQSVETLDLLYAVVADVEHAQLLVLRQTFDLEDAVVREVQLLEVLQLRKP